MHYKFDVNEAVEFAKVHFYGYDSVGDLLQWIEEENEIHAEPEVFFMCIVGPEDDGHYHEEILPEKLVHECGDYCVCSELQSASCLFGPDASCGF